jgi:PAS domain-containing protein
MFSCLRANAGLQRPTVIRRRRVTIVGQFIGRLPRTQAFVLLRFALIIAMAVLLLAEHNFSSLPNAFIILIVGIVASNVVLTQLPARITDSTAFYAGVIIGDTIWITAALLYSGLFRAEFFYLYFLLLLLAAISENVWVITLGTVAVCIEYVFVLLSTGSSPSFWSSRLLIRIPFLLTAAAFYGYLVNAVRRERQHTWQVEQANENLDREISERKRIEEALQHAKDQLRAVLDAVPVWVSWISADLKYLGANRYMASVLNVLPEAIVGKEV